MLSVAPEPPATACVDLDTLEGMTAEAGRVATMRAIQTIEDHKIPVGNSAAGEMAQEWTYEALKEIRDEIRALPGVTLDDLKSVTLKYWK